MKKYFLSLAIMFLLCVNVVFAQKKTPEERADHQTKILTKSLTLNADQSKKAYDIHLAIDKQIDAVRQEAKGKKGGHHGKVKQLNKDRESQLIALLTPEQKTKYEKWQADRKEKREDKKNKKMKDDNDND